MDDEYLASRFEEHRSVLRAMAHRMLGTLPAADDALQEAWLRVSSAGTDDVENFGGWLRTVVARVCLNVLRSRGTRPEDLFGELPDPVVTAYAPDGPEAAAVMSSSIGTALLVVLETLPPAERVAFVLHDVFKIPFAEIGAMIDRTPTAARQLASRARRRVHGARIPDRDPDLRQQHSVVEAFLTAAQSGDLARLVALLHPDAILRSDWAADPTGRRIEVTGQQAVARLPHVFERPGTTTRPVVVDGGAGILVLADGVPFAVMGFTVSQGLISEIIAVTRPERVGALVAGLDVET